MPASRRAATRWRASRRRRRRPRDSAIAVRSSRPTRAVAGRGSGRPRSRAPRARRATSLRERERHVLLAQSADADRAGIAAAVARDRSTIVLHRARSLGRQAAAARRDLARAAGVRSPWRSPIDVDHDARRAAASCDHAVAVVALEVEHERASCVERVLAEAHAAQQAVADRDAGSAKRRPTQTPAGRGRGAPGRRCPGPPASSRDDRASTARESSTTTRV